MRYKICNINIDILDTKETLLKCEKMLNSQGCKSIYFINAHCFNVAQKNNEYRKIINLSNLSLNDGIGIKLGLKFNRIKVKENMNGTDFIPKLIYLAYKEKKNVYLLGGKENIALRAKLKLEKRFTGIKILGYHNGYFNKEEERKIINEIKEKNIDLLIAGMGVPLQEVWLSDNKDKIDNVKICIGGGAILDFISCNVNRAPKWMRNIGLEWFFRLLNEPVRLWKRYVIGNFKFFYYIVKFKLIG